MNYPFLLFALPRSRTAWLAAFLDNRAVRCHHELLTQHDNFPGFGAALGKELFHGNSDSGMALWPGQCIGALAHEPRLAVVERDPQEVIASWDKLGLAVPNLSTLMPRLLTGLEQVKRRPGTLVVPFDMLDHKPTIIGLWHHLTRDLLPFPEERWALFRHLNIQLSQDGFVTRMLDGADNIKKLMEAGAQ